MDCILKSLNSLIILFTIKWVLKQTEIFHRYNCSKIIFIIILQLLQLQCRRCWAKPCNVAPIKNDNGNYDFLTSSNRQLRSVYFALGRKGNIFTLSLSHRVFYLLHHPVFSISYYPYFLSL